MESKTTAVLDSICDAIGQTPMVRLARIGAGLECELFAKCEFMNPGGSIKDRIGARMLLDAERQGRIKPGDTLIEPTSGNTGIGLALAAAARGYRLLITMPEKMSQEKQVVLEALGAEIIRTPTEAAWDSPESHIGVAKRLHEIIPQSHILDQYANPSNPLAHEEGTAREILEQCGGQLDAVVIAAGTGGTITGVARGIKQVLPDAKVIGVDPEGSILAGRGKIHSYKVEGIGYDFIPDVLDRSLVDRWIKSNDQDSFVMARRLIREEGLLVGGSSGAAVGAALRVARELRAGQRVVVILPDSIRNYLTRFASDAWMRSNGFVQDAWDGPVEGVLRALPPRQVITFPVDAPVTRVLDAFKDHGISQVPVTDGGRLAGILTEDDVLQYAVQGRIGPDTKVAEIMVRQVRSIGIGASARKLPEILERNEVAVVVNDAREVVGILTRIDLIDILARKDREVLPAP